MDSNAFDVVLARAHTYREAVYATCGDPPTHFIVTNAEYLVLLRSDDHLYIQRPYTPDSPMRLMGMVVCTSRAWCPEMKALQQRALRYVKELSVNGVGPARFMVSAKDYQCVQSHMSPALGGELRLQGMRVCPIEQQSWSDHDSLWDVCRVIESSLLASMMVPVELLGRPSRPPPHLDSDTTPVDAWETGVKDMIAEVARRHAAKPQP